MAALKGEVVLTTGGASGLGRAIVDRFVQEGANVAAFDRSAERLATLADAYRDRVITIRGDVRSLPDNQRAVETCVERYGKLDCAIGNAGVWDYSTTLDNIAPERLDAAFDEMFHINVKGYLHLAKAVLPALARSQGSIIYTVSNAGFNPAGGGPLYTASKHAVVGLIHQLAYEFAPAIRVNGVAPGPIVTDLRGLGELGMADRSISTIGLEKVAAAGVPLALVPAPEEYAGAYVMLASRRDNRAATGGVISLDTGIAIRGIGAMGLGASLTQKYANERNN